MFRFMQLRHPDAFVTREQATSSSSATLDVSTTKKPLPTPQEENEIAVSEFRPSVLPEDRIVCWTSPYSLSFHASLLSKFPLDAPTILGLARNAFDMPTRITYGTGLLRFHQYCDETEVAEHHRMPVSVILLAGFVAWAHEKRATPGDTIVMWLAGVRAWHILNHADWNGDDPFISLLTRSASKKIPLTPRSRR